MATIALSPSASTRTRRHPGRVNPTHRSAPIRLTRRGRLAVFAAAVVTAASFMTFVGDFAGASSAGGEAATGSYVVGPGDSLWAIAQEVAPAGDTRETVERIKDLNGMRSAVVFAGQELVIPLG
ncbi:MAG: hypothetical protein RJB01_1625 [Actinomycetota bacterium]